MDTGIILDCQNLSTKAYIFILKEHSLKVHCIFFRRLQNLVFTALRDYRMTSTSHFELARNFISFSLLHFRNRMPSTFVSSSTCVVVQDSWVFWGVFFQLKIQYYARAAYNFCLRHVTGSGLQNESGLTSKPKHRSCISWSGSTFSSFTALYCYASLDI